MNRPVTDIRAGDETEAPAAPRTARSAFRLPRAVEPLVARRGGGDGDGDASAPPPSRALALSDLQPRETGLFDAAIRWAYRMGVPGSVLSAPLRKPAAPRLRGTVASPLAGDRAAGVALRAGHLQVAGVRTPLTKVDLRAAATLAPPLARAVHGFTWLRDLGASAPRSQCAAVSGRLLSAWLAANAEPGRGAAWTVEHAGLRLLAWLVHAPLILSGEGARHRADLFAAIETTARWLDRKVTGESDRLAAAIGWGALVAAGLLLPDGKPRRLFAEAGLLKALGELVCDDGGVLSRSPLDQAGAIELLAELRACYAAVGRDEPAALSAMLDLLVPALLTLRMGDRGLANWQGAGAIGAARVDNLVEASGVRARALNAGRHWGYQRIRAQRGVLVMDAAPPPRAKDARHGCASTLAFEFSHESTRIIVNCGGAAFAGALIPSRIEQGLRGTAAHSTLVLDGTNSTAVLINGQIGKGVGEVDILRDRIERRGRKALKLDGSHNGYVARFGLVHRRRLALAEEGTELVGEDILEPAARSGKRGKIGFAIRFHLGPGVDPILAKDGRGAGLTLPDGSRWQFRLGRPDEAVTLTAEDSLWVDGQSRPHGTRQLVIEGLADRGGGTFPWLLKKVG